MKCPHCGIYYMDDERECPVCGKRPGITAKKKKYTSPISYNKSTASKTVSNQKKKTEFVDTVPKESAAPISEQKTKSKKTPGCLTVILVFIFLSVIFNLVTSFFTSCSVPDIAVPEPEPLSYEDSMICETIAPGTWHIEDTDLTVVVDTDNTISWTDGTGTASDWAPFFEPVENGSDYVSDEKVNDYPSDTYACYNLYFCDSENDLGSYDFYVFLPNDTSLYELESFDCYNNTDGTWYTWVYEGETFELP